MNSKLYEILTAGGEKHPYGLILTEELKRLGYPDAEAVKCTDRLYLVKTEDGIRLFDRENREAGLRDPAGFPECADLTDFSTEICLAPDAILPADFRDGSLTLKETGFAVTVRKESEKVFLILFDGTEDLLLFDAARFLLYGFVGGKLICGNAEV